ncbi:NADH dehydrogenase [ubiquinone] iron-sulfur protein 6, mitochondrial [Aplysia californica]|uniref:NADH dehydrogenase [ubiquinone] iron-sulfur protein 6, mitochondrial n=1 Tax=Aplysia californica TaxID=6500 RepID=A0ABM0KA37_APLCA|nr:NADH dehydrogenase [ubiquinone] iron-sulfur protein 6, mitochondrial [Aplysia californica]
MKVTTNMASLAARVLCRSRLSPISARAFSTSALRCAYEGPNANQPTHTGQVWDKNDYRNIRFVGKDKLINPEWAIDLIAEDPVVVVSGSHVWSDSCGALGHPKVYINLDKPEVGTCGYSGRKFVQKKFYDAATHGPSITYEEYLEQMKGDSR